MKLKVHVLKRNLKEMTTDLLEDLWKQVTNASRWLVLVAKSIKNICHKIVVGVQLSRVVQPRAGQVREVSVI